MNMKLLAVVTPPPIYHGCSTRKTLWAEKFTLGDFTPVNMKSCGGQNVRKQRDIKDRDKYITVDISLEFGSLDKMRITSSEICFGKIRKEVDYLSGYQDKFKVK